MEGSSLRGDGSRVDPPRRGLVELSLLTVLLAVHGWLAISSIGEKSLTFDEVAHIGGGILATKAGDFRFNAESGILPQRWAALPFLWRDLEIPDAQHPGRRRGNVWNVGREIVYTSGIDTAAVTREMRAMMVRASIFLGALVYVASRRLFGPGGALLSLGLYAVSPTMLAHGRLVTADLFAAFFFLLATGTLWRFLRHPTVARGAAATAAVAGLLLSKHSGLLILPIALVLVIVHLVRARPAVTRAGAVRVAVSVAGMVLGIFVLVWAAYGFRYSADPALPDGARSRGGSTFVHSWDEVLQRGGLAASGVALARDLRLLPEAYLWGLAYTLDTTRERDAFLRGETRTTGWWWFFPYAVAIKTPLALFGLLLLAAARPAANRSDGTARVSARLVGSGSPLSREGVMRGWERGARGERGARLRGARLRVPLWALLIVYGIVAMASSINIGQRHMLPIYPVLFVLAGGCLAGGWRRGKDRETRSSVRRTHRVARHFNVWLGGGVRLRWLLAILLGVLFAAESWRIRPHYLAYFNQLVGGPENGYRHLVDSSLDWGQDLPALRAEIEELRRTEPRTPVYVAYFGSAVPDLDDLDVDWLASYFPTADYVRPPEPLRGGMYWVSASLLQSLHLETLGPWTADREARYRDRRARVVRFVELFQDAAGREQLAGEKTVGEWIELFRDFDRSRSARLFRSLRQRPPDTRAGYSIHGYRLSDEEAHRALFGPVPEATNGE